MQVINKNQNVHGNTKFTKGNVRNPKKGWLYYNDSMKKENQTAINKTYQRSTAIDLVMTGMFTAILCVMAQITIPTQPIPFTLSLFAIFLIGALLPARYALLSVLSYLLLGAFGIPVFAGMKGGFQILTGMTGGYLMAYPIMAFITALFFKYNKKFKLLAQICGMLLALVVCYLIGTLWFSFASGTDFIAALGICVIPYVPFDLLKIALAISFSTVIRRAIVKISGVN